MVSLYVLGLPSVRVGRELLGGRVEGLWKVTVVLGCRKIMNDFKLWCWRRLLRVPWTARRSNQSILEEISPEYSLEVLMLKLKLKLQNFGQQMGRTECLEKTLILGKIEGRRRKARQDKMVG